MTNEIGLIALILEYIPAGFVRSPITGRNTENDEALSFVKADFDPREYERLYEVAFVKKVLLYCLNPLRLDSGNTGRKAIGFFDAKDDIATVIVLDVIGKGADCPYAFLRIPGFLVFNSA